MKQSLSITVKEFMYFQLQRLYDSCNNTGEMDKILELRKWEYLNDYTDYRSFVDTVANDYATDMGYLKNGRITYTGCLAVEAYFNPSIVQIPELPKFKGSELRR